MAGKPPPVERLALQFSDGSFTIYPGGWVIDKAITERDEIDTKCRPEDRTKIVRVRLDVIAEHVAPLLPGGHTCSCGKRFLTAGGVEECTAAKHKETA
jgi:hypothetical protein